jgi:ABC-type branched-subunit amino acid transport system substrate-binding protein
VIRKPLRAGLAFAVLLAACTGSDASRPPDGTSPPADPEAAPITVPVVFPSGSEIAGPLLEGMRVAMAPGNNTGASLQLDVRETADPAGELLAAVEARPPAVLVLADGEAVVAARTEIEAAGVPVVVIGDDLYSGRSLFRYVFQTSIPISWQARVLATYLLEDRDEPNVTVLVPEQDDAEVAASAFGAAFAEEGGAAPSVAVPAPVDGPRALNGLVGGSDAVVAFGSPGAVARIGNLVRQMDVPPRLVLGSTSLSHLVGDRLPPGSAVVYPYTWAGWATMLPRVEAFRRSFESTIGRGPGGLEQEGYDAVRALSEALVRTQGRGGEALVRALETFRDETYASLPIRLGPDDHVFAEQSQLGVFSAIDSGEAVPGEAAGPPPMRPIMRTFTTDGEKVNILDRDKKVFFPFWHEKRPSPKYWRSGYGIVTRPSDSLH